MWVRISWQIMGCVVLLGGARSAVIAEQPTEKQAEQFAALEKSLSGAAMVGYFTDSNEPATKLTSDRYDLQSVRYLGESQWLFQTRIRYGDRDVTLPLTLPIYWAGDTPVITVEKLAIPGFGTFTARVMIYADHYAGFWSGADHGGHMFGMIERKEPKKETADGLSPAATKKIFRKGEKEK